MSVKRADEWGPKLIRLLVLTTLYPNAVQPYHGIFVEERLRRLVATGKVEARVVAPVPWFPFSNPRFGRYATFAAVPRVERRHGIDIWHPKYPVIPKVGMQAAPLLLASAIWHSVSRLRMQRDFDAIDAHYFYPDGVAAVWLARRLGKPVAVTARGSDINLIARRGLAKRTIARAASRADHVIAVSGALAEKIKALGVPPSQVTILPNGVDLETFKPGAAGALRRDFGLQQRATLLSVGNLVENKGHHIAIEAVSKLKGFGLVIVGAGPQESHLRRLIVKLDLTERVVLAGAVGHDRLAEYYRDAFALVLASSREGMPNVVLEALASGTPVVATGVGGVGELITSPEVGRVVEERTATAFAAALLSLWEHPTDRNAIRKHAQQFGWNATLQGQLSVFTTMIQCRKSTPHGERQRLT